MALTQSLSLDLRRPLPRLLTAVLFFSLTVSFFSWAMVTLQGRQGNVFADPLLSFWRPVPLSLPIFTLTWGTVVLSVLALVRDVPRLTQLAVAYSLLELMRVASIWLVPLEPPPSMILLNDPINDVMIFDAIVTKDLFFSGHVSAIWLLSCYFSQPWRTVVRCNAITVAALLLAQHVHYSIDVAAAPIFAMVAYRAGVAWAAFWDRKNSPSV